MKKSNLYIEKIYRDHPIACWPLDDDISFRQLLSQSSLDWTISDGDFDLSSMKTQGPVIPDCLFEKLDINGDCTITYNLDISTINFDPNKGDLAFSAWIYHPSVNVSKYEIGYIDHTDETEYFSEYIFIQDKWYHILDTFPVASINSQCELFIRFYADIPETIYINAVSLGQEAEEYCSYSIGYTSATLQQELDLDEYGISVTNNGSYSLNEYGSCLTRPGGIPLAFGSYQSLNIISNAVGSGVPIKLPGNGFLHNNGKYNNYTLEFWTRLVNLSSTPVRIFGALNSTDGIYLEEGFISIYLGPYTQSYFVGKWYRPMLIHFEYSPNMVMLFINGERVISIDIDTEKIPFSTGEDTIAFYGSTKVSPYEIDSIALYPYIMPSETAKKHFVYGQGVQEFDFSNDKFLKKTVQIDFPYAEYSYNVIYPDTNKWRSGYSINLDTTSTYIKPSVYELPEVIVESNGSIVNSDQWFLDNFSVNQASADVYPYLSMNPDNNYDQSSIYYRTLAMLPTRVKAVFGTFKSPAVAVADQEVLNFTNKQTGESLKVILNNTSLQYKFFVSQSDLVGTVINTETIATNSYFYAGINISDFSVSEYETIGIFFSDLNKISVSVGGSSPTNTFQGRLFAFHIIDDVVYEKDFSGGTRFVIGIITQDPTYPELITYVSSYTLLPLFSNTSMILDIGSYGYWEDQLPLPMFGKTVSINGNKEYDLDFIQFNIDSQYKQIFEESSEMIPYSIFEAILKLFLDTYDDINSYYNTYNELYQDALDIYSSFRLDTGIKTYVTLQHYSDVGNKQYSDYINIVPVPDNNVITFNTTTLDNTKYEVYDNNILIIPKNIDFNDYYISIYIETRVKGSRTKNMVVKRCELSSFVYNEGAPTRIGTKYSVPIYPFAEAITP